MKYSCKIPITLIVEAHGSTLTSEDERQFLRSLAKTIFTHKTANKWIFKISDMGRFSRGLALLETDSIKVLKDKKKKVEVTEADIEEIIPLMKLILNDKL